MKSIQYVLLLIIVAELAVFTRFALQRRALAAAPQSSLDWVHPNAASLVRQAEQELTLDLEDSERWLKLAEAYQAVGLLPQSETCFRHVTELSPSSSDAFFAWGRSLEPLGQTSDAIDAFGKAMDLGYQDKDRCWHHIGLCHLREEAPDKAMEAFGKVTAYPPSRFEFAKLLVRSGDVEAAIPILDDLIAKYPVALEPYQWRSRAAEHQNDPASAKRFRDMSEWANKLKDLEPKCIRDEIMAVCDAETVQSRLVELLQAGKTDTVVQLLSEQLEHRWTGQAAYMLADINFQRARLDDVKSLLDRQLSFEGPTFEAIDRLGDYYYLNKDADGARSNWERALRLQPNASVHSKLANLHRQLKHLQLEIKHNALSKQVAGIDAFRAQQFEDAKRLLEEATQANANLPQSWFYLGEVLRTTGADDSLAINAYRRCLALDKTHGRARYRLQQLDSPDAE